MRDAVRVRKDGAWATDASAVALLSSALERAHGLRRLTLWGSAALFAACPTFGQGSSASIDTLVLGGDIASLPLLARAFPHVRSLAWRNFEQALKEIPPSASEALGSLAELRKWNDEFGEGRKAKKRQVWGKDRFGFTVPAPEVSVPPVGKVEPGFATPGNSSSDNSVPDTTARD